MSILIVDCETTSLYSNMGSLVNVGVTELDENTGMITPKFEALIKDGVALDPKAWVFQHTTLTPQDIEEKGLPIEQVVEVLNELFKDKPVTAYNTKFDYGWLRSRGVVIPNEYPCIMETAKSIMKSQKYAVPVALAYYKIEAVEPHQALDDSILEAVILRCIQNHFPKTQHKLDWNVNYDITRFSPKPKAEVKADAPGIDAKKQRYLGKIKFFERLIYCMDNFTFDLDALTPEEKTIQLAGIQESKAHILDDIKVKYDFCKKAVM
jgi:DNA polymerase III epsilon subunit-like protein